MLNSKIMDAEIFFLSKFLTKQKLANRNSAFRSKAEQGFRVDVDLKMKLKAATSYLFIFEAGGIYIDRP